MGADGTRSARLVRAAAVAACALLAVSAAVITAWQYSARPSAQYVSATRISSSSVSTAVRADVSDARIGAAAFDGAALPWWVDHGSSCAAYVTGPLWVSHGSVAHWAKPESPLSVAV